ncbi:PepSY-associated TM helix domain-containing protein [Hymenobacter sp. BT770]|uniref:PepSY-associated TM helix domain-containing protein n=1 Tax=Hymenobacter sp. BT770 TaxID=2886942 RepID=UPI001D11D315|nr:PepSY-associated TM helix domain-containing protein [Hymenobacter sp. BT770]MCC3152033.1 PepSY domain-containing protein [Hymenobacter sp. BT770]MDO3415284.1 PepSY-associated TM helix domain-containing protein [Hymenobacter sp. BT770]
MSPAKSLIRNIHLYLGLVSGLVIVFVCLTGSILAFEKEIEQAWHPERYFVAPSTTAALPLARLVEAVGAYKPKAKISGVKVYADPTRTVEISLAGGPEKGGKGKAGQEAGSTGPAKGKGKGDGGGPRLYVNPYTAAVTGEMNPRDTFFHTIEQLHRGLVAGKVGKLVMGVSASIFLFILGTGLVLWWPAMRKAMSQRLQVKWGSSWKRLNHDFHIVLGFYASLFLFVMALTGVGMSFDWVGQGINQLTHSPLKRSEPPVSAAPGAGVAPFAPDAVLALARQQAPDAESYALQLPKEPTGSIRVSMLRPGALTENATDEVFLDQYSGQVISGQTYAQRPVGQRIRGLFKPVHTGAIFGWPTKLLALTMGLLGATFPITGTIMWLNRLRKNRKKHARLQAV